jgi:dienelactone hydrolase
MKKTYCLLFLLFHTAAFARQVLPEVYGFRHLQTVFRGDMVDILVKSKKGEEQVKKPLLLFCQGSLPIPLIIRYNEQGRQGIYNVFVFNPDSLSAQYHLAIIGKPYVPLMASSDRLDKDLVYRDSSGRIPRQYNERNTLDYYVNRNIAVIRFLQNQSWVSRQQLVVAGHSEGSTIAAKMAAQFPRITQLIYSGGNPMGRILTLVERARMQENDSSRLAEKEIDHWRAVVADSSNINTAEGDSHKTTYGFSIPPMRYLERLTIPVLVCYGTKDASAPFNDYLRIEMIRRRKKNFCFKAYIGTEHNYFPLHADGSVNYDVFNWDKVAADWQRWLTQRKK